MMQHWHIKEGKTLTMGQHQLCDVGATMAQQSAPMTKSQPMTGL